MPDLQTVEVGDKVLVANGPQRRTLEITKVSKTIITLSDKTKIAKKTGYESGRKNLFSTYILDIFKKVKAG